MAAIHNRRERTIRTVRTLANVEPRPNESCESYLASVLTNPLSMKQLSRIQLRNMLIEKMKDFAAVKKFLIPKASMVSVVESGHHMPLAWLTSSQNNGSILATLIEQLELPISLKRFLYEFPDVPPVPLDLDVYIQY